jgi:hypothetical protein
LQVGAYCGRIDFLHGIEPCGQLLALQAIILLGLGARYMVFCDARAHRVNVNRSLEVVMTGAPPKEGAQQAISKCGFGRSGLGFIIKPRRHLDGDQSFSFNGISAASHCSTFLASLAAMRSR